MKTPTPFPEINQVVLDLHDRVKGILGDRFFGMYFYGSLAIGGFEPSRSDIDFVVITQDHLPDPMITSLEMMHMALTRSDSKWPKKLEGAYVPKAIIRRHDPSHPPVPTLNEGDFYMAPLGSDWTIQRSILRDSNSAISGPPLRDLIDPVSAEEITAAIHAVIDNWWEPMLANPSRLCDPGYQPFAVLSMCRMLYTVTVGDLTSKSKAAIWALESLPPEWSSLIKHSLAWAEGDTIESIERTTAFMQYAIDLCRSFQL